VDNSRNEFVPEEARAQRPAPHPHRLNVWKSGEGKRSQTTIALAKSMVYEELTLSQKATRYIILSQVRHAKPDWCGMNHQLQKIPSSILPKRINNWTEVVNGKKTIRSEKQNPGLEDLQAIIFGPRALRKEKVSDSIVICESSQSETISTLDFTRTRQWDRLFKVHH
jgi:hypothetical protein